MKRWLRFEDKYGLSDIYCAYHGYEYLDSLDDIRGADRLQVGTGNPGCFLLNSNTIAMKHKDGYNQCVVIFDMDPLSNNDIILSTDWLQRKVYNYEFVTYAPVVWCAETVLCNSIGVGVDELLHPAKEVCRKLGSNRTKRFRDVIDRNRIKEQLDSYRDKTRYNRKLLSVICDGELGYTFTEVLDFIRCVESDMNKSIIDLWEKVPPSSELLCYTFPGKYYFSGGFKELTVDCTM